jgi:hypothetical protein
MPYGVKRKRGDAWREAWFGIGRVGRREDGRRGQKLLHTNLNAI